MKHIKKKLLFETEPGEAGPKVDGLTVVDVTKPFDPKILKESAHELILINTDTEKWIGGFSHNVNGKYYVFPIPDLTLVYFHHAQVHLKHIETKKKELLDKLSFEKGISEVVTNEMYSFFGLTCGFVIFLFISLESFINQCIPKDYVFERKSNQKTELYSNSQILRYIDFKTKSQEILPTITGKKLKNSFVEARIENLKDFRDGIVHTKQGEDPLVYDALIKKALGFKYEDTLRAVASFMNFYKNNYVVECPCGQDF